MKILNRHSLMLALLALALPLQAQVTVSAGIDSLQLYIGEQARVKLEVSCPADGQLVMPAYPDNRLMEGIEIVGEVVTDTQYLNKGMQMLVKQEFTVTSFDTAFYFIPPFEVMVDSQSYASNPLALKVFTFEIDTMDVEAIFPIKGVVERPITGAELLPLLISVALIIGLCFLIPYLLRRYKDDKPILRRVTIAPKLPPHQVALKEMERIKEEKAWQHDDIKGFYTELTDALRTYMQDRFGFNAMEMTSCEIIRKLDEQPDKEWIGEVRELFTMADLVKFAKYKPLINENDMNLVNAIDFVNRTKVEEETPEAPQVQEIVVREGRPKQQQALLAAGIALLCVLGAGAIYVAVCEVIHLFF